MTTIFDQDDVRRIFREIHNRVDRMREREDERLADLEVLEQLFVDMSVAANAAGYALSGLNLDQMKASRRGTRPADLSVETSDSGRIMVREKSQGSKQLKPGLASLRILTGLWKDQVVAMPVRDVLIVGRGAKCDVVVRGSSDVSRRHARATWEGSRLFFEDLNSTNGTRVNGQRIKKGEVFAGDLVTLGPIDVRMENMGELPPGAAEAATGTSVGTIRLNPDAPPPDASKLAEQLEQLRQKIVKLWQEEEERFGQVHELLDILVTLRGKVGDHVTPTREKESPTVDEELMLLGEEVDITDDDDEDLSSPLDETVDEEPPVAEPPPTPKRRVRSEPDETTRAQDAREVGKTTRFDRQEWDDEDWEELV